ncbi:hypothetical protein Tco_1562403 [Tanacetum coccineum]
MVPATTHLIGFSGETIWSLGQIALLVKIGDEEHSISAWMNFMLGTPADMTGRPTKHRGAPLECPGGIFTSQAKEERIGTGKK